MKRYFRNLLTALMGRNPLQAELQQVKKDYATAVKQVKQLEDYYRLMKEKMAGIEKQVMDYQTLTDNLRQRIMDKDELMARMKEDYQKRIENYNVVIDKLQAPSKRSKKRTK